MKTSKALQLLTMLIAVALLCASTFLNATYSVGTVTNQTLLTLTTSAPGSNFTIPAGSTITVYDSECKKIDPQPPMAVEPSLGTATGSCKIRLGEGYVFPTGGKVIISVINTPGDEAVPTGAFGT